MPNFGSRHAPDRESGQVLVLFALGLVAIIAMVGLVLDGSGTFAQRRHEQNSADLGTMAGANAYMNTPGSVVAKTAAAIAAGHAAAARNGYTNGVDGAAVTVSVALLSSGAEVRTNVSRAHQNNFASIVGMSQWDVSVTAAAVAGSVDTAVGAAPWIMDIGAFNPDGSPKYGPSNPQSFGETNGDYPTSALDLAWTDFNGSNNVNTNEVRNIINGTNIVTSTIQFGQYIGQHNQGNHTALYGDVNTHLAGKTVPVPIVGPCPNGQPSAGGCFKGWALFYVISASGGSNKTITGYFIDDFVGQPLTVGACTPQIAQCGVIGSGPFDNLVVRLTD